MRHKKEYVETTEPEKEKKKRMRLEEIDRAFEQFLPEVKKGSGEGRSRSSMDLWMEDFATGCPTAEPKICELTGPEVGFGAEATIKDPWGESLQLQAEARAEKWAGANKA